MTKVLSLLITFALLLAALACNYLQPPALVPRSPAGTRTPASGPTPTADQTAEISGADLDYYDIRGGSAADLRKQMNALGPLDEGRRWDAYTGWHIHWNWPGYGTNNCDLSRATTSLEITVTLPRWANPDGADAALITKWNKYYEALARHEQAHVDTALDGYPKVLQAIQNATCATAEQAALQAVEPIHEADRAYDQETRHGATEGAVFP